MLIPNAEIVPTSNVEAVTAAATPGVAALAGGSIQSRTVSFAPEVLKSICSTIRCVAGLLMLTTLPRADATPSVVLLTVPRPKPVSVAENGERKPANRLLALLPLKKTPTLSPPELPLPLNRKLIYFVSLDRGLARFSVV